MSTTPTLTNNSTIAPVKAASKPATAAPIKKVVVKPAPKKAAPKALAAKPAAKPVVASKKPPAKPAAKPIAKAIEKPAKVKKPKMVRDSFTMPKAEFAVIDTLKLRAAGLKVPVKKTELIRAGIKALAAMSDTSFLVAVRAVPNLKTGRPAKSE